MPSLTILRITGAVLWVALDGLMIPAIWRMSRGRTRALDPIWGCAFLLFTNRLAFLIDGLIGTGFLMVWCHASSLACGALFGAIAWRYQRHDA